MSYNSYRVSSSYGNSGMSRGRGFSNRGSFRGRGGGDTGGTWGGGGTSRGRGFSGPSRGRFNWYKENTSGRFDSSSRYASGSSGMEKYSSRGRGDDSGYRRYSRTDTGDYSPREHRVHRSPESQRKRMRTEHAYVQASSTRRSHEGGYGGGADYNSRYSYSEDKGSYGEDRGRVYRDDRRSTGTFRDRSREDYTHRKSEMMESSMPPPSSVPPRHMSSPRGSFKGRLSTRGARGMSRMLLARRTNAFLARKRSMADSYSVRKRILTARTQADTLRRLRILKLRRLREAAAKKAALGKKENKEDSSKATEDISDEEEEDELEKVEDDEDEGELEEGETTDEKTKKVKKEKPTSKDEEPEEGEDVEDEDLEDEDNNDDEEKKTETKKNGNVHVTIKQDSDARAVSEEGRPVRRTFMGKPFIKLSCPHCFAQCVTFQEYTMHLFTSRHISAMRKQSLRHKQTLAEMRLSQRQKQRLVEESEEARGTLSVRTKFCHICKLNYRQLKSKHVASEYHREMMKFLMPICYVCQLEFKSPMLYENHLCSLDHIRRKASKAERQKRRAERLKTEEGSGAEDEDKDLNLDNFMILDSVGDVDDTGEDEEKEEGEDDQEKKDGEEKKKKTENLGADHVKNVEVYYCELCSHYLPRSDNPEKTLTLHCRTRTHLQRYVRHRDDELLRKEAERIHRKRLAKRNAAKEAELKKASSEKKDGEEKMDDDSVSEAVKKEPEDATTDSPKKKIKEDGSGEASQGDSKAADMSSETIGESRDTDLDQDLESGMDDKLWADVDKDLGELLREVEPGNKSSDEDDDSHAEGGRYDRFRYSEKGSAATADPSSEGDATKAATEGDEPAEVDAEEDKDEKEPAPSESEASAPAKKASVTPTSTPVAAVN